jgi:hypothetical protein
MSDYVIVFNATAHTFSQPFATQNATDITTVEEDLGPYKFAAFQVPQLYGQPGYIRFDGPDHQAFSLTWDGDDSIKIEVTSADIAIWPANCEPAVTAAASGVTWNPIATDLPNNGLGLWGFVIRDVD